jgi:hypothetical protein
VSIELEAAADLRNAFFRMLNISAQDFALVEHDSDSAYQFIQLGLWDAQRYVIEHVDAGRWVSTTATITWLGSDTTDGKYFAQPADFLMFAGSDDPEFSALRGAADGAYWGQLIKWQERFRYKLAPCYYPLNERIYKTIGAEPPSGLVMDYHHRHATLDPTITDDEDPDYVAIDFPLQWRQLIVAFAATNATAESWLPGGSAQAREAENYLRFWKAKVASQRQKSHTPPRMVSRVGVGPNMISPTRRGR